MAKKDPPPWYLDQYLDLAPQKHRPWLAAGEVQVGSPSSRVGRYSLNKIVIGKDGKARVVRKTDEEVNADMEKEFKYRNILKITEFLDNYEKYEERGLSEYKFLELTDMLNDSREILHTIKYFIKLLPAEFCDFIQPLTIDVTEHIKAISEFLSREEIKTLSGKVYDDFREIYNDYK